MRFRAALLVLLTCGPIDGAAAGTLPFIGKWNCEVADFTFTATTYDTGNETLDILSTEQDQGTYRLNFADGYLIELSAITPTSMTWVSGASDDRFTCARLE